MHSTSRFSAAPYLQSRQPVYGVGTGVAIIPSGAHSSRTTEITPVPTYRSRDNFRPAWP
jgi:hypothetical protein